MLTENMLGVAILVVVVVSVSSQAPACKPNCLDGKTGRPDHNEICVTLARCPFKQAAKCNRCAIRDTIVLPSYPPPPTTGGGTSSNVNMQSLLVLLDALMKSQQYKPTTPPFGSSVGGGRGPGKGNDMMNMFAMSALMN